MIKITNVITEKNHMNINHIFAFVSINFHTTVVGLYFILYLENYLEFSNGVFSVGKSISIAILCEFHISKPF
jgi:hypothetical protein